MTFANEMISDQDRKEYGLDKIECASEMRGMAPQSNWTIDRERRIYLRNIKRGREDELKWSKWHFYWQGNLLTVCMEVEVSGEDIEPNGSGWVRYKLVECHEGEFFIPDHFVGKKWQIINDLKLAISDRKGGIYSGASNYDAELVV